MRVKRLLCSILALAMVLSTMSFTAFAAGDTDEANAVASIGDQYYSTVALAMADAQPNDTIIIHKDINDTYALTAPTVAPLTFKAATAGIKITGRAYLPKTDIDGVVTYDGFDFTANTDWTVQQWDGDEKLNDIELVYKNCNFGTKGICISWHQDKPDWNLKKITLDGCTASDAKEVFSLQYVDEVVIKNCNFSNSTQRLINVSAASGDVTVNECNFGTGAIQLSQNVGTEERNLTVENSTFIGEKAVVIHENLTNASTQLGAVELTNNTVEETTELIIFKDETVNAEEYIENNVSSVIAAGNETVSGEAVTEISTGYTPAAPVASINGKYYLTLAEAVKNATDEDEDGAITYHIYGKAETTERGWINPRGNSGATTVNFVGMTDDAEICLAHDSSDNWVQIMGTDNVKMDAINYTNLKLSKPNGVYVGDVAHQNRMFTTWMRGASTSATVTYTDCVFPNGSGNNQYGKTVYNNCEFYSEDYYALWIYDAGANLKGGDETPSSVVVNGGSMVADRGVKVYSENQNGTAAANTTITGTTFDIESKPAVVSSLDGTITMTDVNYDACEYGLLEMGYLNGNPQYTLANTTVDGEEPKYVAAVTSTNQWGGTSTVYVTDNDYAELVASESYTTPTIAIPVAKVSNANGYTIYESIQAAIDAAVENDTITIYAGTYNAFTVPADKNNLTFVGETGSIGLSRSIENLVTIKTLEAGVETHNGGVFVQAETTTFKNLNFTAGTVGLNWMSSSLGNTNGDTGMSSSLKNLTVENCNFTGSGAYQAIWTNQGNITLKNSTITNYNKGIDNYAIGADQKVVIENSEITDVYNAFHTGEAATGAEINVTGTEIDSDVIDFGGAVAVNVAESTIKNAKVTTYASSTLNISESALYDTTYAVYEGATGSITLDSNYVNNVNEVAENAKAANITFDEYYQTASDLGTGNTVAVPAVSDAIYVKFENVTDADAEGEMLYNINLVATDDEIINRLNSADLTFDFDVAEGDVAYEIIASNSEVAVNAVDNSKVRYEFHYNGKDGVTTDSANTITIGQVKFNGYGKFDFTVDATVDTNAAHATTVADNIVDTFIPNGDAATVANGELVIDDNTITDVVIAVPDRNLTINIDFPNAVEDQVIAYQDMKVVISGGDLAEDITIDLGSDAVETALDIFGKETAKYAADMVDGSYVIDVTDALTLNNAYTVTISGAGYRTARYTVTMTEDKVLKFWNNVMDEKQFVEIGKDSSKVNVTFLAGDIVKDNKINIYDLSAVVSYFGQTNDTAAYDAYAKYDLNRDGVIDSKDVAYVLVSWNN